MKPQNKIAILSEIKSLENNLLAKLEMHYQFSQEKRMNEIVSFFTKENVNDRNNEKTTGLII